MSGRISKDNLDQRRRRGGGERGRRGADGYAATAGAPVSRPEWRKTSVPFRVLSIFLVAMFAMTGSHRLDNESLMFVRPISALVLGYGLSQLTGDQIKAYRWLFGVAIACIAIALVQLVPLPANLFFALPGHGLIGEIDRAIGNAGGAHPISMAPTLTRNALWSMMVPVAVLVLGVQLSAAEQARLLPLLILVGIGSAVLGGLQILGDPNGPLYTFQFTDRGLPVGLFANRNHQGVFLATMVPMLGVWLRTAVSAHHDEQTAGPLWQPIVALALGAGFLMIIVLTGSRTALAMGAFACISLPLVIHKPASRRSRKAGPNGRLARFGRFVPAVGIAGLGLILLVAVSNHRALSIDRLFTSSVDEDMRFQVLPIVKSIIAEFWPLGSGLDTFQDVFRMHETPAILLPEYMANAHDDWLEVLMTAGAPGAIVLVLVVALWLSRLPGLIRTWTSPTPPYLVRLGFVVFLIYAMASFTDYHLQDGSIDCLIILTGIWMVPAGSGGRSAGAAPSRRRLSDAA